MDNSLNSANESYWNDEEQESKKVWNILQPNGFENMERYLHEQGIIDNLIKTIKAAGLDKEALIGAELASGNCWGGRFYFEEIKYLEYLYFVEYSNYRIKKIAPHVCEHYSYPSDKISLILSSFYETTIETGILDFVVMVESFMCADKPDQLLKEIHRILKYKGKLLLVCENSMGIKGYLLYTLSNIKMKLMRKKSGEIFEHKKGDSWIRDEAGTNTYDLFTLIQKFRKNGYKVRYIRKKGKWINFVLEAN